MAIPYMANQSPDSLQENVTRVVQALMGISGIKQHDLFEQLGMAQPTLSQKMSGTRRWSIDDLEALARAFGVLPQTFLTDPAEIFGDAMKAHQGAWRGSRLTPPYVASSRRLSLVRVPA